MSTTESHTEGLSTDISRRLAPERTSALPAARQFESWVMDEVLPSIRKHGLYITDRVIEEIRTNPKALLAMLQARGLRQRCRSWHYYRNPLFSRRVMHV